MLKKENLIRFKKNQMIDKKDFKNKTRNSWTRYRVVKMECNGK